MIMLKNLNLKFSRHRHRDMAADKILGQMYHLWVNCEPTPQMHHLIHSEVYWSTGGISIFIRDFLHSKNVI